MNEHDGHLEFTFPPTSTPGGTYDNFGGHVGTLCKFPGDFDAQVDFHLVEWPASNGLYLGLTSFLLDWRTPVSKPAGRATWAAGQQYTSFTGFWSNYIAHGDSVCCELNVGAAS